MCGISLTGDQQVLCTGCFANIEECNLGNWLEKVTHQQGLDAAYSGWYFDDILQDLIHSLKYSDYAKFGILLGSKLGLLFEKELSQVAVLTAVPLHPVKQRERGYNQSEWIVRGINRVTGTGYDFSLLKRIKYTETQTALNSIERQENMRDAFVATVKREYASAALVDDVLTTGATLSACAQVLQARGIRQIIALTCSTPRRNN